MIKNILNFRSREQILITIFIIICLSLCINSLIQSRKWVDKTFPGFLVHNNLLVSQVALKDWALNNHNIKYYDKILKVDNQEVTDPIDVYSIISKLETGVEVEYLVERDSKLISSTIPTLNFNTNAYLNIFVVQFIVGFIILLTGIVVYFLRPNLSSSKILLFLCLSLGGWFIFDFDNQTTFSVAENVNFAYLFQIFTPAFFVLMSFYFPEPKKFIIKKSWVLSIPLAYSTVLFILQQIYRNNAFVWKQLDTVVWVSVAIGALYFVSTLVWSYFKTNSSVFKQKAYVAIIGSFLGFLSPAVLAVFFILFGMDNISLLTVPVLIFPLSIAYSIVKHKLFDIDLIMQRTVLYGVTTGIVAGVFIAVVYGLNSVVSESINWQNPATVIFFCGLLVIALNPLRDRLQSVVDRMFFRNRYDYRTIVTKISKDLTTILNVDRIADTVVSSVGDSMNPDPCELIILNKKTGHYDSFSPGINEDDTAVIKRSFLVEKNRIIKFLENERREIFREDLFSETTFIGQKEELLNDFEEYNISLVIPVAVDESMLGYLSLGDKKSGKPYNSIDLSLLQTLANQAAIAIENSYALKLIESYSDELEEKNVHLSEVQSQLVHAEKMSSIGQLASGIAHEIRNPLNIIEGARYYLANHLESSTKKDNVAGEYLEYIANEIQRTNKLIDELLLFSKPTDSQVDKVNFNELIDNILILTRKQVNDHSVKVEKIYDPDLPSVYADSNQIWQVFVNLLINALESMGNEGHLQIKTGIYKVSNDLNKEMEYVYIIFKDNGQGISDESVEKIFDPFFTTKASGTGLGLSVGYKIINGHNGRMLVNSEPGKGTKFMVEIPVDGTNING